MQRTRASPYTGVNFDPDGNKMKESQLAALRNRTVASWGAVGIALRLPSDYAVQFANQEFDGALEAAKGDIGGAFHDSPLGTMWMKDKEPRTKEEVQYIGLIESCAEIFQKESIAAEEVIWFWDLSTIERFIEINSQNVVRNAIFIHLLQVGPSANSLEEAGAAAGILVQRFTPSFDMCHPSFHSDDPNHPLPYEMISSVSTWYLHELATRGLGSLSNISGKSQSVNAEARRLRRLNKI
jgi:hypothetical protein